MKKYKRLFKLDYDPYVGRWVWETEKEKHIQEKYIGVKWFYTRHEACLDAQKRYAEEFQEYIDEYKRMLKIRSSLNRMQKKWKESGR